jgi:dephospho-CoA kinase
MRLNPLQIGITGGIGSGKSTVCKVFELLNIPIYEADSRARWLMNHHPELKQQIKVTFGQAAYTVDNQLDRAYLASQVFTDGDKVKVLNSLVHPKVGEDYLTWVADHAASPYLLNEAALMIESGRYKTLDKLITVFAPLDIRIDRVQKRDPQRSKEEIEAIIQKQITEEEKIALADYVIYNDNQQLVIPQVLAIHQELLNL